VPLFTARDEPRGMDKVSIGLRGWRFDEDAVLTADGEIKPFGEMDPEVRERVLRLQRLHQAPCDACWLIHGDENAQQCRVARVVYGEPFEEVVLCGEHEADFHYWFHEQGGRDLAGTDAFEDGFYEWFADGGRAPEDYGSVEHRDTDPDAIPDLDADPTCEVSFDEEGTETVPEDETVDDEVPAGDDEALAGDDEAQAEDDEEVAEAADLGMDYPTKD
jgi:hypothetical protein